ncbi:hypothetical protein PspLS_08255 [Pyricularia sp. CBS 133598]|nr:hypothetical protein PspLS_08255 [Pyricularia sp. CBS 133598]
MRDGVQDPRNALHHGHSAREARDGVSTTLLRLLSIDGAESRWALGEADSAYRHLLGKPRKTLTLDHQNPQGKCGNLVFAHTSSVVRDSRFVALEPRTDEHARNIGYWRFKIGCIAGEPHGQRGATSQSRDAGARWGHQVSW